MQIASEEIDIDTFAVAVAEVSHSSTGPRYHTAHECHVFVSSTQIQQPPALHSWKQD